MAREWRPPTWMPWALCWLSVALLVVGVGIRIALPEGPDDAAFYAVAGMLGAALIPMVGGLLASRLPSHPYGWLWAALGLLYGVASLSDGLRRTGTIPDWVAWLVVEGAFVVILCLLVLVFLLFPTGRLPGRAWRWLARTAVVAPAAVLLVLPFSPSLEVTASPPPWAAGGRAGQVLLDLIEAVARLMLVLIVLGAVSVLVRFRRAEPIERQQLKWFVFAAALLMVTLAVDALPVDVSPPVWAVIDGIGFALLPVAVGIAVLRYRLYEIDRIVSRTVSYTLLTGGLVGLYLALIALLRPLLEPVTGSSSLAVAASTLAVAALFNPARRRLQAAVDRRFDRARYDAALAVDAFAARLRDQVDLDQVTAGLRDTVAATVAPTRVAVWLRVPSGTGGA